MRILFDQAAPVPIRFVSQTPRRPHNGTARLDKLRIGDLLTVAEQAGFDLLLTTDKNMRYQQNLAGPKIAIVVLAQQQWPYLRPHIQLVVEAVDAALPGSYMEVEIPHRI